MARFRYQALSRTGDRLSGELDAASDRAVIASLQADGHWPIAVRPVQVNAGLDRLRNRLARRVPVLKAKALAGLIERLGMLVTAGIAVEKALEIEAGTGAPVGAALCLRLRERVRGGTPLSAALAGEGKSVPPIVISMIRAGEAGGFLALALNRLSAMLTREVETGEKIEAALAYPRFLLIASGLFVLMILGLVLPQFRPLFEDAHVEPPFIAAVLFALSRVVEEHLVLIGVGIGLSALALRQWLATSTGRIAVARARLRLPWLRELTLSDETGRFCRSLGTLVAARVALPEAVRLAGETARNAVIADALRTLPTAVAEGRSLSTLLRGIPLLPAVLADLTQVGEETGRLAEMLERAATLFEREAEMRGARLMALLVPAVTIGLGLVVAVMIGAVVNLLIGLNELAG